MRYLHVLTLSCGLLLALGGHANNIHVANAALVGNTGTSAMVQFDISWENSWRGGGVTNWDAAWVFVKYRLSNGVWQHVLLNNTGHVAPAGSVIDVGLVNPAMNYSATTNPVVGAFIHRDAPGNGTFSLTNVQLSWDYGSVGLAFNDIAEVQVFAVEMVYVPQGAFAVGSGGSETGSFTDGAWTSGATIPRQVTSKAAITIDHTAGNLWAKPGIFGSDVIGPTGTLSAAFPKGFAAFYSMKYEMSQQQYADFLNTLTYTQQATRTATAPNSTAGAGALVNPIDHGNGIVIQTPGVASSTRAVYACNLNANGVYGEPTDGKEIACNYLSWGDLTAYLDWSGLRPMTELEFEKACRGTLPPGANEYPWGTTGLTASVYTLSNVGATNEGIATNYSTTLGNANYDVTNGATNNPLRVGVFAANGSNSGRATAGASYYGIMELGGNVNEDLVIIGNTNGRAYNGSHGNGALAPTGEPDGNTWPAPGTGIGSGLRGGSLFSDATDLAVSDRLAVTTVIYDREFPVGGRGVRLAP